MPHPSPSARRRQRTLWPGAVRTGRQRNDGFEGVPASITTPDTVKTRLGTLEFRDGAPTPETAEQLYDHLDFSRGVEAYLNSLSGASLVALRCKPTGSRLLI